MVQRLEWADVARAAAIALVVLYHVGNTWLGRIVDDPAATGTFVREFNTMLVPVRMPLFFLVSGVLATRALDRRWVEVRRRRVADMLWPFVIWTAAFAPLWALAYGPGAGWTDTLLALSWIPQLAGAYWYLPALAVFFAATWLVGRHRRWLLLAATLAWLVVPMLPSVMQSLPVGLTLHRLMMYGVWFVAGATLVPALTRLARAPVALGFAITAGWSLLAVAELWSPWDVTPLLSLLGITAAVILSGAAARIEVVGRVGRYLGARTLSIYLVHPAVLAITIIVLPTLPGSNVLNLVLIFGATALLVAGPALLQSHMPRWLFRFPSSLARRVAAYTGGPPTVTPRGVRAPS